MAVYEQYPPRDGVKGSPCFFPSSPSIPWGSVPDVPPPPPYSPGGFQDHPYPQQRRRSVQMSEYPSPSQRSGTPKYDMREPARVPTPNAPFYVPPSHHSPRMNTGSPRQPPPVHYPQQQMYEVPDPPYRSHTPFFIRENGRQLEPLQEQVERERERPSPPDSLIRRPPQTRMMHFRYHSHRSHSQDRYRREGSRDSRQDRDDRDMEAPRSGPRQRYEHRRTRAASVLRHHPYRERPGPNSYQYRGRRRYP